MFVYPWNTTSLAIALTLTAIPVLTQLAILPSLFRNKKMLLLTVLLLMFMAAQVLWGIWAAITFMMYNQITGDPSQPERVNNAVATTSFGLNNILYCTAHWIYAMKYWVISFNMVNVLENKPPSKKFEYVVAVLYYGLMLLNILVPIYEAVNQGLDLGHYNLSFQLLIYI